MIKGRGNVLEIPVVDAVVVQVLHSRQDRTRDTMKYISLALLSPGEEQSNVPKHCYSISFREVTVLAEALKELAADSEVAFCPRLELFVTHRKTTKHVRRQTRIRTR